MVILVALATVLGTISCPGRCGFTEAGHSSSCINFRTDLLGGFFGPSGVYAHRNYGPFERVWQSNKEIITWLGSC